MAQINKGRTVVAVLILSIALSGCGMGQGVGSTLTSPPTSTLEVTEAPPPTNTLAPTRTPEATNTLTPSPLPAEIQITTPLGNIILTEAEIANADAFGNTAAPGYQILNVYFKSADGSEIDGSAFYDESKNVSVMGDDGSETKSYTGGLLSGQLMVGFTPPDTAHSFTLVLRFQLRDQGKCLGQPLRPHQRLHQRTCQRL